MRPHVVVSIALVSSLVASVVLAQTPTRSCVRVEVSTDARSAPLPRPVLLTNAPVFSATKVLDLNFTVLFPATVEGEHLVELRVFTPDAQLYRSLAMPVAPNVVANAVRNVDGYTRPLAQQPLARVSRGRQRYAAASTAFPVGGTDIVSSGLYGRWRVEAYLDGAKQRCAPAAPFTLKP